VLPIDQHNKTTGGNSHGKAGKHRRGAADKTHRNSGDSCSEGIAP
jgi:hypothetical protein